MEFEGFNGMPLDEEEMRLENELMKLRLQAEYGAIFPDAKTTEADPGPEYAFLKRVLSLHQRLANTPPRPLREILDFSRFPDADSLDDELELNEALWDALDYLEDENVMVDFDYSYPDRTMYEFITRELPELEVIGKPTEDELVCILYEAFHPNIRADLEDFADEFFEALLSGEIQTYPTLYFSIHQLPAQLLYGTEDELHALIARFLDCFDITDWNVEILEIHSELKSGDGNPDEHAAVITGSLRYATALSDNTTHTISGDFRLNLEQSGKLWYAVDFQLPGFIWPAKDTGTT
jgi:hypothetical protein